jgi:hypothetical protein
LQNNLDPIQVHPKGEREIESAEGASEPIGIDTFGGRVRIQWDPEAPATPFGQLGFFIQFLKTAHLFLPWVQDCPLHYTSPNAPSKVDVLGTYLLAALAGQKRYAHITAMRSDQVNPRLLGMNQVMSEDSIRRAFQNCDSAAAQIWQQKHLRLTYEPLLTEPYILDIDTTVKPLYGRQEGAKIGFNPQKPGRPSHVYHTYFIANVRLVVDSEVQAGNRQAAQHTQPGLWQRIDSLPKACWPTFLRGDCVFGNEAMMQACEQRQLPYLFKLRLTTKVKSLIQLVSGTQDWSPAGGGWQGIESSLQLMGWSRKRRVIVLRRRRQPPQPSLSATVPPQVLLPFEESLPQAAAYEYAVLVTSLGDEISALAQHYRDRADAENGFDELKNQWGWGGFTTQDLARCQITARIVAQVYNWWSIFLRLAFPGKHLEGISSRPLLLYAIGTQTQHSGQTTLTVTSTHAKASVVQAILTRLSRFFRRLIQNAEQLTQTQIWRLILSAAFKIFLRGKILQPPPLLAAAAP